MDLKSAGIALGLTGLLFAATETTFAQPGPDGGAVLRSPFDDPAPTRPAPLPGKSGQAVPSGPSLGRDADPSCDQLLANLSVDPRYAMNKDIEPTPQIGPWMICVHSYVTPEAPAWARQMASELRSTYKLPAYVFTYGLEERRKEYERVKATLDQQREFMRTSNLELMYAPRTKEGNATPILSNDVPLAYAMNLLKVKHIQVQCAILVGGYPSEEAAYRALLTMRDLPQPDPDKVKLDVKFYGAEDPMNANSFKFKKGEARYINPFKKAFVCRNPSVHEDSKSEQVPILDINVLRRLNADEPFSLLQCKKPITLAIKQYQTFTTVQDREEKRGLLENWGLKTRGNSDGVDQAAHDAHGLAEILRENKLECYVLHTKFSSIVCIGGYDGLEDPNLRAMQNTLETRLRAPEYARLMFFPKPMPMKVPQ